MFRSEKNHPGPEVDRLLSQMKGVVIYFFCAPKDAPFSVLPNGAFDPDVLAAGSVYNFIVQKDDVPP